jgi:4-hydroxybenzoate polyprenyltransferase
MKHIIRLIRLPNLLMMAATMVLMRYCIIQPLVSHFYLKLAFPLTHFILLVISVTIIAAAGYIINDYFDINTDEVNRPEKVVLGQHINPKSAYIAYFIMNFIALCITFYLSIQLGVMPLFTIFPITIGVLWFYSTTYKKQLLIGNILVSLMVAGVPLLVAMYEILPIYKLNHQIFIKMKFNLNVVFAWIGMFTFFAFIVNLIRELVKDSEDIEGDRIAGRNTLPVAFGLALTRKVIAFLVFITISVLSYTFFKHLDENCSGKTDIITLLYFLMLIFIPLIIATVVVFKAKEKKYFTLASTILKIVMVLGILYSFVFWINIIHCNG